MLEYDSMGFCEVPPEMMPEKLGKFGGVLKTPSGKKFGVGTESFTKYDILAMALKEPYEDEAFKYLALAKEIWGDDGDETFDTIYKAVCYEVSLAFDLKHWS